MNEPHKVTKKKKKEGERKIYKESINPVSIPTVGNWKLMSPVNLNLRSRHILIFMDLPEEEPPALLPP